jgi:hypothetical protein
VQSNRRSADRTSVFFGSSYEIMYDAHAVVAWAMDRLKKYRAEFKFDERSVAPDGLSGDSHHEQLARDPVLFYGRLDLSVSAGRRYLGSPQKEA